MRLIPLDEEAFADIDSWVKKAGATKPPDPNGLPMCAGTDGGNPRAFATVRFLPNIISVDGLVGSEAGCRYIVALCEEIAVSQSAVLFVRGLGESAAKALQAEGALNFGGQSLASHLWARDPGVPKPGEAAEELDDEEGDEEDLEDDEDEDDEEAPPPPPRKTTVTPRRKRKNKRKK